MDFWEGVGGGGDRHKRGNKNCPGPRVVSHKARTTEKQESRTKEQTHTKKEREKTRRTHNTLPKQWPGKEEGRGEEEERCEIRVERDFWAHVGRSDTRRSKVQSNHALESPEQARRVAPLAGAWTRCD